MKFNLFELENLSDFARIPIYSPKYQSTYANNTITLMPI